VSDVQLLGKTEIWMQGVHLSDADLPELARRVASVLSLPDDKVFVTDVREALVVLDVLQPKVELSQVVGRQPQIFAAIDELEGVRIEDGALIHSEGVLGVIGSTREQAKALVANAERMDRQIREYASGRVAVVSTGTEIIGGEVRDTNFEAISEVLGAAGFDVEFGGVAEDSERAIAGLIARLSSEGYGLIITTGGVGAEDKDHTIEAVEALDANLAIAILAKYEKGHGRHVKDSVRICVGNLGWSTIISLPGPTHEVQLALPVIVEHLKAGTTPAALVEAIAVPLRATLPAHGESHHHDHGHRPRHD